MIASYGLSAWLLISEIHLRQNVVNCRQHESDCDKNRLDFQANEFTVCVRSTSEGTKSSFLRARTVIIFFVLNSSSACNRHVIYRSGGELSQYHR